jgi:hypothetical protein
MKLFRRGDFERPQARANGESAEGSERASHRLTLELKRVETFAAMLAHSRSSNTIEVSDYLAGMYICNWDRLSEYWDDHERDEVESLLRGICRISPQRWHSWIEYYDRQRHGRGGKNWNPFREFKKKSAVEMTAEHSANLAAVLKQAEEIAPAYDRAGDRSLPILTTECVLLCIVRNLSLEIGRKLAATGLDVARLEKDALLPRHPPRA